MIALTDQATQEISRVMTSQDMEASEYNLRVRVDGGGCSGFSYKLTFEEAKNVDSLNDNTYKVGGLTVAIDRKSALYLDGTTVDFCETTTGRKGFKFNNPNAKQCSGCNAFQF